MVNHLIDQVSKEDSDSSDMNGPGVDHMNEALDAAGLPRKTPRPRGGKNVKYSPSMKNKVNHTFALKETRAEIKKAMRSLKWVSA